MLTLIGWACYGFVFEVELPAKLPEGLGDFYKRFSWSRDVEFSGFFASLIFNILTKSAALAFAAAIEEIMAMPLPSETAVITDSVLPSSNATSTVQNIN